MSSLSTSSPPPSPSAATDKGRLKRVIRSTEKIGCNLPSLQELYAYRTLRRAGKILADPRRPKASCHMNSFFLSAAGLINKARDPTDSYPTPQTLGITLSLYTCLNASCLHTSLWSIFLHIIVILYITITFHGPYFSLSCRNILCYYFFYFMFLFLHYVYYYCYAPIIKAIPWTCST